ncbi:MAG TPA: hypothetical protein VEV17_10410 [Bryobacteraceae bacterium]|nr:hypothetical protein [Bryobacteraceae bacterium]
MARCIYCHSFIAKTDLACCTCGNPLSHHAKTMTSSPISSWTIVLLPISAALAVASMISLNKLALTGSLAVLGFFLVGKVTDLSRK